MVGQEKLLKQLNSYSMDTFPHSCLLVGEKGCGKHTVVNYVRDNILHLPVLDITENLSFELIDNIYRNPNPNIYLIDITKITEKDQNTILKFVEEPLKNSFIFLLTESNSIVLNTIYNRCIVFEFERYTQEQLKTFIKDDKDVDLLLSVLTTPGQILDIGVNNVKDIYDICTKIVDKISVANYANTLSIAQKINYKDEYSKFDINIFFNALSNSLFSNYLQSNNKNIYEMYKLTGEYRKRLLDQRLNKEQFVENFLSKLWQTSRVK